MDHGTQLPDDILLLVATYLDEKDAQNLYFTRPSLLGLALDLKYRAVSLFSVPNLSLDSMIEYNQHLTNPEISRRIRSLTLDSSKVSIYDLESRRNIHPVFKKVSFRLKRAFASQAAQKQLLSDLSRQVVRNLTSLDTLTIIDMGFESPLLASLVSLVWKERLGPASIGKTLQHLRLHIALGNFHKLAPSPRSNGDWPLMNQLEVLEIKIFGIKAGPGLSSLRSLLQLLHAPQHPTHYRAPGNPADIRSRTPAGSSPPSKLRYLSLHFHERRIQQQLFYVIFTALGSSTALPTPSPPSDPPFPDLTHFSLTSPGVMASMGLGVGFLTLQAGTITHLRLSAHHVFGSGCDLPPLSPANVFAPPISSLEYLEITGTRDYLGLGIFTARAYLTCTELTRLKTLVFDADFPLSFSQIQIFLRGGPPSQPLYPSETFRASLSHICHLSIPLITLTPGHLSLMSRFLPGLRSLDIRILADGDQGPFRGSYPDETFGTDEPQLDVSLSPIHIKPESPGLPNSKQAQRQMQDDFVEELNRGVGANTFGGWNIEAIGVSVCKLDNQASQRIKEALRGIAPKAKIIEVGEGICTPEAVFRPI